MTREHRYSASISWTGNLGKGTSQYAAYSRNHDISAEGKPTIHASSDAVFRGDPSKYSPEELLVSSLSGCHMLWYLHLCATHQVVVTDYSDHAMGVMHEHADGSGEFSSVTLRPRVTVSHHTMVEKAKSLHADAHRMCFVARSVNFPVHHIPEIRCYEKA